MAVLRRSVPRSCYVKCWDRSNRSGALWGWGVKSPDAVRNKVLHPSAVGSAMFSVVPSAPSQEFLFAVVLSLRFGFKQFLFYYLGPPPLKPPIYAFLWLSFFFCLFFFFSSIPPPLFLSVLFSGFYLFIFLTFIWAWEFAHVTVWGQFVESSSLPSILWVQELNYGCEVWRRGPVVRILMSLKM